MSRAVEREPRAELRTLRLSTGVVGATTLAATVATSVVISQPHRLALPGSAWTLPAVAVVLPLLAAGSAPWSSLATLRRLNGLVVVEYGALLSLLALAAVAGWVPGGEVPWLITFTAAPVTAALVAWGRRVAWLLLGVATGAIQLLRVLVGHDTVSALASDVQAFFASATLLLLLGTLIEANREFDRSTRAAYARASQRSAAEARAVVRQRLQALVHDELLTTLVLAARGTPALRNAVAAQAARARRLLRDLHRPETADDLPVTVLLDRLREAVAQEAPAAEIELTDHRTTTVAVDFDVAEALTGGLRQALVNSRLHAGPAATVSVGITVRDDRLQVVVADDGLGFDPGLVPPGRLGVSVSIVGRLRGVPGGDARVESRPGEGTRVTLVWTRAAEQVTTETAHPAAPDSVLPANDRRVRGAVLIAIAGFWVAQAALAGLAAATAGGPWVGGLALGGVGLAFLVIGWTSLARPATVRAWSVVALVAATTALSLVPVPREEQRYGDTWYIAACGFVLLVLAVRGRPGIALLGGLLATGLALAGVGRWPNDVADVLASTTRHVVILAIGVWLVLAITRTQARTARLHAAELATVRSQVFREAATRELRERSRSLEEVIGRMLERLESGAALTEHERRECAALDGRLRDQHRGGRLSREPLIEAAMAARRRGVDVVLLDDAPDRALSEAELDAIAGWLTDRLVAVPDGRFTGRILPSHRAELASAVAGEEVAELTRVP